MKRKIYKTRRLVIRPYRPSDYKTWFDAYVNRLPKQNRFDVAPRHPKKCSKAIFNKMCRRHKKAAQEDRFYAYGVFLKKSGVAVGVIDVSVIHRNDYQMGNLGYQIHNKHWRKGYAAEAVKKAFKIAAKDLKIHRLEAAIESDNKGSLAVAKSTGMYREGIKKNYLLENGKWVDHVVYVMTPEISRRKK